MERFIVKHYASDAHPSIKGNGFDGLLIAKTREEAEEFIDFVNKHMFRASEDNQSAPSSSSNTASMPCLMYAGINEQCDVFGEGRCGSAPCNLSRHT